MKSHTELNFGCVDSFFPFFCTQLSACSWWEWCSLVNWLRFVRWTNSVRKERKEDRVAQLKYENDLITFYQILWFNTKKRRDTEIMNLNERKEACDKGLIKYLWSRIRSFTTAWGASKEKCSIWKMLVRLCSKVELLEHSYKYDFTVEFM